MCKILIDSVYQRCELKCFLDAIFRPKIDARFFDSIFRPNCVVRDCCALNSSLMSCDIWGQISRAFTYDSWSPTAIRCSRSENPSWRTRPPKTTRYCTVLRHPTNRRPLNSRRTKPSKYRVLEYQVEQYSCRTDLLDLWVLHMKPRKLN